MLLNQHHSRPISMLLIQAGDYLVAKQFGSFTDINSREHSSSCEIYFNFSQGKLK